MAMCLECGFADRPEASPCPKCGAPARAADASLPSPLAAEEVSPTDVISFPHHLQSGLAPGYLLARKYEIRKRLGGGGFGWVYLAHDAGLDKDVAVKVLHLADPSSMDAAEAKKRFLREARAMARLDEHPNIVRVMNVDEDHGVPYFVMEYLPGGTLLDLLKKGPLPPARAASLAADVAAALSAVHASGTIHRDLKPANIFIKGERAMLGDFGIAYVAHETTLTMASSTPGTPMYMSPEALLGKEVDARTDLFSLGCVLYETLTGGILFKGDSVGQVVGRIIDPEEVEMTSLVASVPPPLLAVLKRSLAKRVAERYPSARFMERDLRAFAADPAAATAAASVPGGPSRLHAERPRLSVPTQPAIPGETTVRAVSSAPKPPASPASDRRSVALASVAVVLAAAALWFVVRSLGGSPPASSNEAKPLTARTAGDGTRASAPGGEGRASPAPKGSGIDIGVEVQGPVQTIEASAANPPASLDSNPAASPKPPDPETTEVLRSDRAASGDAGSALPTPGNPSPRGTAAPSTAGEKVSSSWRPTHLEEAIAKGFRPSRDGGPGGFGGRASGPLSGQNRPLFMTTGMQPPELIHKVDPEYPENARAVGEEGRVIVEVVLDRGGDVAGAKVVKGDPLFDGSALEAVRQWKFRPAMENGRPVRVLVTITLEFKLSR